MTAVLPHVMRRTPAELLRAELQIDLFELRHQMDGRCAAAGVSRITTIDIARFARAAATPFGPDFDGDDGGALD